MFDKILKESSRRYRVPGSSQLLMMSRRVSIMFFSASSILKNSNFEALRRAFMQALRRGLSFDFLRKVARV